MDTPLWSKRLDEAKSQEEVVGLVREYIESRDPEQLALLPPECTVPEHFTPDEIAQCAYALSAHHGHDDSARIVQRMASVLSRAAVRLAELKRLRTLGLLPKE